MAFNFDKVSHEWWEQNNRSFKMLHKMNEVRVEFIINEIQGRLKSKKKLKLLDLGCGGGILLESLAKSEIAKNIEVFMGVDMSGKTLEIARGRAKEQGLPIEYKESSIEDFCSKEKEGFDIIIASEVIEHVDDPNAIIPEIAKLLNPEGLIFFSTINRNPKSFLLAKVAAEYLLRIVSPGTHEWKKFLKPSELVSMLRSAGLEPCKITGMKYDILMGSFSLDEHDLGINYILSAILKR